jgi:hypothetical protein
MKNVKIAIISLQIIFLYWLLFGGGELNSPSLGIQFMLWMGQ